MVATSHWEQHVDDLRSQTKGNPLIASRFEAIEEHLRRNGVDLTRPQVTLGPWLRMDLASERFVDNASADVLLRRQYRNPYVVPEKASVGASGKIRKTIFENGQ
jgi:hypothetical protein